MEELKKSERPFYGLLKLFDQISDSIVLVQDGIIQYVNQKAVSMAESPPEEIIGKRFELFIASEDLEKVQNLYRARLSGENVPSRLELRLKAPSGKMTLVEAMADIVGYENQPTAVAILRDITERRRLEEQKKVLEIWNSRLLEKAPIPIVITDNQGSILEVNPAFTSLLGYENTEIKGKCLDQVVAKDEYLEEAKSFSLRSSSGQILSWESTRFRKDGQPISVRIVVIPIVAENKVLGKYVLYFDQTEKREAELKIKRNEERYRTIFECSRDAVFIANQRARFVEINQAACELTGYTREELLRMSIPDLHEEIDLIAYKTYFKRILEGESVLS
jgi:PAS domain S-box-containing protein